MSLLVVLAAACDTQDYDDGPTDGSRRYQDADEVSVDVAEAPTISYEELERGVPFDDIDGDALLARFTLANGNVVDFFGNPKSGEYGMSELILEGNRATFEPDLSVTTLERYIRLSDPRTPVPRFLVDHETDEAALELAEGRELVEALREPGEALEHGAYAVASSGSAGPSGLAPRSDPQSIVNDDWNCGSGDTSANFADDFCVSAGGSNKVTSCDSNSWLQLIRGSYSRKRTYSVTGYCGSGGGRVEHEYRRYGYCGSGWQWCTSGSVVGLSNNQWKWVDRGGPTRTRRVTHERTFFPNGSGYVRAYTVFYN